MRKGRRLVVGGGKKAAASGCIRRRAPVQAAPTIFPSFRPAARSPAKMHPVFSPLHCEALQAWPDALRCESIPVAARTCTTARYGIAGHRLLVDLAHRIGRSARPPDGPAARAKRPPGTPHRPIGAAARWPCSPRETPARHTASADRRGHRVYMATKTVGW